jgi:carboxyl-terminal processing protease
MKMNKQSGWVSITVVGLAAFSFFAGLGLRGLVYRMGDTGAETADSIYPKIASAAPRLPDPDLRPALLFRDVLNKLRINYVDELPANTDLAHGSIDYMLNRLDDPNTRLVSKTEMDAYQSALQGRYQGLGAVLTIRRYLQNDTDMEMAEEAEGEVRMRPPTGEGAEGRRRGVRTLTVVSVLPGTPAEKAGLQPGDRITEINGRWIAPAHVSFRTLTSITESYGPQDGRPLERDEPIEPPKEDPEREKQRKEADEARQRWQSATDLPTALQLLNGAASGDHELTIERGRPKQTVKAKVKLGETTIAMVENRKLNDQSGYVRLTGFNAETPQQAREALEGMKRDGVTQMVIDLRQNPGGDLEAARDIASLFIGSADFAVLKQRDADRKLVDRPVSRKGVEAVFAPQRLSVLVDGGTAGTAELLAASLRDHVGARLVGSTTFGDGTEQELIRLENGWGISITRAKMLTSRRTDFDGKGIRPDVTPQGDPLDAALQALAAAPRGS